MKKVMMVLILIASSQSFAATTLNDAFTAALQESDADHIKQQVVLDVSPSQIEKATFKRDSTVHVVNVEDNMLTDIKHSAPKTKKIMKPTNNEDFARLQQELNEI